MLPFNLCLFLRIEAFSRFHVSPLLHRAHFLSISIARSLIAISRLYEVVIGCCIDDAKNLFACSSYFFASLVVDLQTYLLVSFAKNKLLV